MVSSWPVGEKGLLYDREWVVVGETGAVISQKQEGRLCLVQPSVDLQSNTLTLYFPGGWGHVYDHKTTPSPSTFSKFWGELDHGLSLVVL